MPTAEIKREAERRMRATIDALKTELKHIRTGRASVSLIENVLVEYYGTPTPLNQVANLSAPDATMLLVQPWEASLCPTIDKAIRSANLGLNPASDGKLIRIPVPQPTEERRKELVKKAHAVAEHARVEARHHRHEANDRTKKEAKASTISADEEKRTLDEIQKMTDRHIAEIDAVLKQKEGEILSR